ncbi:hypothetical protein AOQ84DRAFT_230094 [Glonium stellatum]|uniref:Uncharacterized protein n=1 Tax=Glonium stellatum TaxID=574774 RepID=A0A8E2EN89_9PEZI|nr:hypothetical protein AOQ84DRAFT_230094 [Glonium stellatum]
MLAEKKRANDEKKRAKGQKKRENIAPYMKSHLAITISGLQTSDSQLGPKDNDKVRVFEISGLLANRSMKALGDYGAKKNFIKEKFAICLGLAINRNLTCEVIVGSGEAVTTSGVAKASFRFKENPF